MLHGLLFTVGLLILSGLIAYIGDTVGRRVARRKLHILGLRPGVVSSLTAVLTGVVIAVGTFLIITAVSKDVRRMFFEYDQTIAALAKARAEYQTAQAKNEQLRKNNEHLQEQLTQTTRQQAKVTGDLAVAEGELKTSSSKLVSVEKQYDENRKRLSDTQREFDAAQKSLAETKDSLAKTSGDLDKKKKELAQKQQEVDTLDGVRQGLIAEGKRLEAEIERLRTRQLIIGANRPLAYLPVSRATNLADARTRILQVLYQIRERLRSKNLQLADITAGEINDLTDILSKRSGDVVIVFTTESNVVAGEKVGIRYAVMPNGTVFSKGETIVKADIAANATRERVETDLRNMLVEARGIALDRGLLPDVETGEVGTISAAKFNDTVAALADRKGPAQVSLVSTDDVTTLGDLNKIEFTIR